MAALLALSSKERPFAALQLRPICALLLVLFDLLDGQIAIRPRDPLRDLICGFPMQVGRQIEFHRLPSPECRLETMPPV